MEKSLLLAKLRMTAVSLAIWACSAAVLVVCTLMFWYQDFLFMYDGGYGGLSLIIPIDLILGPGLMFVIYNPSKPSGTKLVDIAVVIAIQLGAFGYGLFQVYEQHPVLITYYDNSFGSVRGEMMDRQKTSASVYSHLSNHQPPFLFVKPPTKDYIPRLMNLSMNLGVGVNAQVDLLDSIASHKTEVFGGDHTLRSFVQQNLPEQYQQLQAYPADKTKLAWFEGRYCNVILVFDNNANYLGYIGMPANSVNPAGAVKPGKLPAAAKSPATS